MMYGPMFGRPLPEFSPSASTASLLCPACRAGILDRHCDSRGCDLLRCRNSRCAGYGYKSLRWWFTEKTGEVFHRGVRVAARPWFQRGIGSIWRAFCQSMSHWDARAQTSWIQQQGARRPIP